jgi:hypothetical protein
MGAADISNQSALLKTRFPEYAIKRCVYRASPLNSIFERDETFDGDDMKMPVIIEGAAGYSTDFATAQADADPTKQEAFRLVRKPFHGVSKIKEELFRATKNKRGAFQSAASTQVEGIFYSMGRQLTFDLYGDGKGYVAFIKTGTTIASTTALLTEPNDSIWFQRGQTYQLVDVAAGSGAGALRATTKLKCVSVNRKTGAITFDNNLNTVTGAAVGDAFVVAGTFNNRWSGLRAWLVDNPSATLFFQVNRTVDPTRLAGQVIDGSQVANIFEAFEEVCKAIYREGGMANVGLCHPDKMQRLIMYLESKSVKVEQIRVGIDQILSAEYAARARDSGDEGMDSNADFGDWKKMADLQKVMPGFEAPAGHYATAGYAGISINTQCGPLAVYSDPSCPSNELFALQSDTWKICTLGGAPHVVDSDGLWLRASPNDDSVELRTQHFGNLGCKAPGFNGRVTNLPAN